MNSRPVHIISTQDLLQQKIGSLERSRKEKDDVLAKQERDKLELVEEKKGAGPGDHQVEIAGERIIERAYLLNKKRIIN